MGGALGIGPDQDGYYTREQVLYEIERLRHQLDGHRTEVRRLISERDELRTQLAEAASRQIGFAALLGFWEQGLKDEEVSPNPLVTSRRAEELALACVEEEEQEILVEDLLNFLLFQCPPGEDAEGLNADLSDATSSEQGVPAEDSQFAQVNAPPEDDLQQQEWDSIECPVMEATSASKAEGHALVPLNHDDLFY